MRCGERSSRYGRYWRGPSTESRPLPALGPTGAGSDSPRSRVVSMTWPTGSAGGGAGAGVCAGGGVALRGWTCEGGEGAGLGPDPPPPTGPLGGRTGVWATSRGPVPPPTDSAPEEPEGVAEPTRAGDPPPLPPAPRATTWARPSLLVRGVAPRSVGETEGPTATCASEPRPPSPPPPAATKAAAPRSARGAMSDTPAARAVWRPQSLVRPMDEPW